MHPKLYLKMCPLVIFGPPCCDILATALNMLRVVVPSLRATKLHNVYWWW